MSMFHGDAMRIMHIDYKQRMHYVKFSWWCQAAPAMATKVRVTVKSGSDT
jgi:hypothetical protein